MGDGMRSRETFYRHPARPGRPPAYVGIYKRGKETQLPEIRGFSRSFKQEKLRREGEGWGEGNRALAASDNPFFKATADSENCAKSFDALQASFPILPRSSKSFFRGSEKLSSTLNLLPPCYLRPPRLFLPRCTIAELSVLKISICSQHKQERNPGHQFHLR